MGSGALEHWNWTWNCIAEIDVAIASVKRNAVQTFYIDSQSWEYSVSREYVQQYQTLLGLVYSRNEVYLEVRLVSLRKCPRGEQLCGIRRGLNDGPSGMSSFFR